ncbi:MAG: hypothetical protein EA383_01425 [Spirochaetaceae bacterium]|nr:MAG: hypothetical protein EA383_01425 [Spirochaetaceae bacterium]
MSRRKSSLYLGVLVVLVAAFSVLPARNGHAQQWQLVPEVSFSTFSVGWPLADTAITGFDLLQARNGAYLQLGYGLSLQRDYYLLIPDRESAVQLFGGYEQLGATGSDGQNIQLTRTYVRFSLDQVLLGDRVRANRYLMLSLSNTSRWVLPHGATADDADTDFFTHTPDLRLSFKVAEQPDFWQVLGLSGSIGAALESGHTRVAEPWAFLVGRAELGASLPLLRHWLYLETHGGIRTFLTDLNPGAEHPVWYYPDDHTRALATASVDLKSRVLRTNPMIPLGVELGAGIGGRIEAGGLRDLDPGTVEPVARVFVDLAVDSTPMFAFRLRSGVTWHVPTGEVGLLFAVQ